MARQLIRTPGSNACCVVSPVNIQMGIRCWWDTDIGLDLGRYRHKHQIELSDHCIADGFDITQQSSVCNTAVRSTKHNQDLWVLRECDFYVQRDGGGGGEEVKKKGWLTPKLTTSLMFRSHDTSSTDYSYKKYKHNGSA